MIDSVEVKQVQDLSPRDIEHDNPEFRRLDEMVHFLEQIYGRKVEMDDTVTVVRFSQISDRPSEIQERMRRTLRRLRQELALVLALSVLECQLALSLAECQHPEIFYGGNA